MSKTTVPTVSTSPVITKAPTRFNTMPTRAISPTVRRPLPNTIALGGVATGIIKAHDAESVAGIIRIT